MAKFVAAIVAFSIFFGWIRLVGNPHVIETAIGLLISLGAGFWVYWKLRPRQ